jgi:hypothetical protein
MSEPEDIDFQLYCLRLSIEEDEEKIRELEEKEREEVK